MHQLIAPPANSFFSILIASFGFNKLEELPAEQDAEQSDRDGDDAAQDPDLESVAEPKEEYECHRVAHSSHICRWLYATIGAISCVSLLSSKRPESGTPADR
jgi:hypothetical protein